MLKISAVESTDHAAALRLEGQVHGPWVEELNHACQAVLANGRSLTLDLGEVSFVDRDGVQLLLNLRLRNVRVIGCTPFVREQLRTAATVRTIPPAP
jgi:anti-anti-sigma regulatory factor